MNQQRPQRPEPKGVSGKLVLIASVVFLGLGVPGATWACYLWVTASQPPAQPLIYDQRDQWAVLPAKPAALIKSGFLTPPREGVYNDYSLSFTNTDAVRQAMTRALSPSFLTDAWPQPVARATWPLLWLKSQHDAANGNTPAAETALAEAFRAAPRAIRLRFLSNDQQPIAGLDLGTLILTLARTRPDGTLDESIKLVAVKATTNRDGCVWLPIDHTPIKLDTRPDLPGYQARWFEDGYYSFPSQAGAFPDVILTPTDGSTANR